MCSVFVASADASMIAADELSHSYAFFHRICQDDTLDGESVCVRARVCVYIIGVSTVYEM